MIKIDSLSFTYKGAEHRALDAISLEIADSEFLGVIGESGAGKTTLSYAINGIIPHHYAGEFYGSVTIDGMDTFENDHTVLAHTIGSVLGDVESQITSSVVEDEIVFGLENFGLPRSEIKQRLESTLDMFGISELRQRTVSSLSGGQKQKVAIASIAALRPKILILDEPTGELDPQSSIKIFELISEMNRAFGTTVIVIEQKIMLLANYVKRLAVLSHGKICRDGTVRDVLRHSDELRQIGVNCPRVVTLSDNLSRRGFFDPPQIAINVDEAALMIGEKL